MAPVAQSDAAPKNQSQFNCEASIQERQLATERAFTRLSHLV